MARPARRLQPARPARAVVYCRVSTDEQGDSGLGLEAQEATCRRWAEYRGVEVVTVTHDVCSGARPPADRDGFGQALALLGPVRPTRWSAPSSTGRPAASAASSTSST